MNNQLVEVSYPSAGGLLSEKFGYDKAGNRLTRERRTVDSIIMETYCHDNCNRIKELNRKAYELDGVTPKLKKSPAVSNNPDAVASYIGERSYYSYDRSGNLLSDGSATYTYDGFERTAEVKMANGNSQINRYDAEGLRAEMEENGQLVKFLFIYLILYKPSIFKAYRLLNVQTLCIFPCFCPYEPKQGKFFILRRLPYPAVLRKYASLPL